MITRDASNLALLKTYSSWFPVQFPYSSDKDNYLFYGIK